MPGLFADTRWSLIITAGGSEPGAREALARLFQVYWPPLYAFVRRKGHSPEDAQDLVQGFCAHLMEKNGLATVDRARGRFRSWLLASLQHYLANEYDKRNALKAGGGQPLLSLDRDGAEEAYLHEPTDGLTPEHLYARHWTLAFLRHVLGLLREEYVRAGAEAQFDKLKDHLMGEPDAAPYQQLAEELGSTPGALKTAASRLRARYTRRLREEVERTVERPEDVDDELRTLLAALG
jgi:RNA polymerase sigma-70 factor (ECF subfamily)